jgi:hypothetical protein
MIVPGRWLVGKGICFSGRYVIRGVTLFSKKSTSDSASYLTIVPWIQTLVGGATEQNVGEKRHTVVLDKTSFACHRPQDLFPLHQPCSDRGKDPCKGNKRGQKNAGFTTNCALESRSRLFHCIVFLPPTLLTSAPSSNDSGCTEYVSASWLRLRLGLELFGGEVRHALAEREKKKGGGGGGGGGGLFWRDFPNTFLGGLIVVIRVTVFVLGKRQGVVFISVRG